MPKGKNELAVLITLRALGISIQNPGRWAAQIALCRLLAQELDDGENVSASLIQQYRCTLAQLQEAKVDAVDEGDAIIRKLRSV